MAAGGGEPCMEWDPSFNHMDLRVSGQLDPVSLHFVMEKLCTMLNMSH